MCELMRSMSLCNSAMRCSRVARARYASCRGSSVVWRILCLQPCGHMFGLDKIGLGLVEDGHKQEVDAQFARMQTKHSIGFFHVMAALFTLPCAFCRTQSAWMLYCR